MQENESESDRSVHKVTMEMANEYLQIIDWSAGKTAFATMLCILSPIVLLMLGAMSEMPDYHISENAAAGIGICVLIVFLFHKFIFLFFHTTKNKNRYCNCN